MFIEKKFGKLKPFQHVKASWWVCKCDCGSFTLAEVTRLEAGERTSCGCLNGRKTMRETVKMEIIPRDVLAVRQLYQRYQKHGRDFTLSVEQFKELITANCFYCGSAPQQQMILPARAGDRSKKYVFQYNGIDRKDNAMGYVLENCLTCCSKCNFAKRNTSFSDFMSWVALLAQRHPQ